MSTNYPGAIDTFSNPSPNDPRSGATSLSTLFINSTDAIAALEAKVGATSSAVTTSHDYKLSEVTSTDKAVSKTATQTLTNKTLTAPVINIGSDTTGDIYYRNSGGALTRLPIGTSGQILDVSSGGIPEWIANPSASDASTTVKGVVEEATQAEVNAGTAAGGTGARLFINPSTFGTGIANYVTTNPSTFGLGISTTASGDISALDYVYANGANTSKRIQISAFNTQSTPTTALTNGGLVTKAFRYDSTKQIYFTGGNHTTTGTFYAVIGTINAGETDLSFSSNTIEASCYGFDVCQISVGSYLVIYRNATVVKCRVITFDGTTVTVGSASTIETTGAVGVYPACSTLDSSRVFIAYDENTTGYLKTQVLSISGTTITTNTPNVVTSTAMVSSSGHSIMACNSDTDKTLVMYTYYNGANYLARMAIVTTSGTTVSSYGTEVTVYTLGSGSNTAKLYKVSTNRAVTFSRDASGSTTKWLAYIITVSGTTVTVNTGTQMNAGTSQVVYGPACLIIDSNTKKAIINTSDGTTADFIIADLSGTTISIVSTTSSGVPTGFQNCIIKLRPYVYGYYGGTDKQIFILSTTEQKSRVGVAASAISSSSTGTITTPYSLLTGFTGLTSGAIYYIDDNGTFTTDLSTVASNKEYGVALSTTSMLLK